MTFNDLNNLPLVPMYLAYLAYSFGNIKSYAEANNMTVEQAEYVIAKGRRISARRERR